MILSAEDSESTSVYQQEECNPVFIKYFEGYSCREIANMLHIPVRTVREKLRKSKRKLRISFRAFKKDFFHMR